VAAREMKTKSRAFVISLAMVLAAIDSAAAPVGSIETQTSTAAEAPEASASATVAPDRIVPQATETAKALDLLLQLQAQAASAAAPASSAPQYDRSLSVRNRRPSDRLQLPAQALRLDNQNPLVDTPAAPKPAAQPGESRADWTGDGSSSDGASGVYEPRYSADASDTGEHARIVSLPRAWIDFIRENRKMVIAGAVVLLGLIWGGSALMAHMRR
jgi:hypothetical protein